MKTPMLPGPCESERTDVSEDVILSLHCIKFLLIKKWKLLFCEGRRENK